MQLGFNSGRDLFDPSLMNLRSGITITASYAIKQSTRLLKVFQLINFGLEGFS